MRIENVNYVKQNADRLPLDEPMTIIQNGEPAYVIESYLHHKQRDETLALAKLLALSVEETQQGKLTTSADFKKQLMQRKTDLADQQNGTPR